MNSYKNVHLLKKVEFSRKGVELNLANPIRKGYIHS